MFRLMIHNNLTCKWMVRKFHKAINYFPKYIQTQFPATNISKLRNELKVVSENWHSETCTVGLWIDIGSRCENDENNGIAHFLEHMYFKGTENRNHLKIQTEALQKGAFLNSYMTREMISISVNCHKDDLEWAISLLGEIVSKPKYDDAIVEKEKNNILYEMQNVERNCREVVLDYLHATAYQGTPLGRSILGTKENVQNVTSSALVGFIKQFYKAPRMVLAAAGGVDHSNLNKLAEQYLSDITCNYESGIDQRLPCRFTASDIRDRDDALPLGHVAIAFQGPGWAHTDSVSLLIASAINGSFDQTYGGSMYTASKLAGAAFNNKEMHSFQHFLISYHDTSLWGYYFTSIGLEMQHMSEIILMQMVRICTNITEFEVTRAKNQLKTQLLSSLSGTYAVCDDIGRHMLVYGRRIPIDEMITRIDVRIFCC